MGEVGPFAIYYAQGVGHALGTPTQAQSKAYGMCYRYDITPAIAALGGDVLVVSPKLATVHRIGPVMAMPGDTVHLNITRSEP